jgi:hypothetical protein
MKTTGVLPVRSELLFARMLIAIFNSIVCCQSCFNIHVNKIHLVSAGQKKMLSELVVSIGDLTDINFSYLF